MKKHKFKVVLGLAISSLLELKGLYIEALTVYAFTLYFLI